MTDELHYRPITELHQQFIHGDLTAVALTRQFLDRIERLNPSLHSLITVNGDSALAEAADADQRLQAGETGPLTGIPITVKDAIPTRGIRTTYNSRLKQDWIPDAEPLAITRLRNAGAIIIGKANANEFFGIPSDDDLYPRPRSPFNTDYVCMGSSSGSGSSVAAGLCAASIGSDSAGSVRLPAAHNGLCGIKVTNGRISRHTSESRSTFQVLGPLARTTADAALLTQTMIDRAPDDDTTDFASHLDVDVRGWKVGVPWRYIRSAPLNPDVLDAFTRALDDLARLGIDVVEVALPGMAEGRMATFVAMYSEHHAEQAVNIRQRTNDYGRSARLYAMQGAFISALDYINALKVGDRLRDVFEDAFSDLRAIAMPTCPFVTAEESRRPTEHRAGINTAFTAAFNLTGHPAMSLPCGIAENGIPVSMQLTGRLFDELTLFQISHAYERLTPWHTYHRTL
jgi:aspartyl-tRNA(Asn)/glutamyl-tRNA(Gln) amidotransferase subunit A